jgi:hypothetical protein
MWVQEAGVNGFKRIKKLLRNIALTPEGRSDGWVGKG